MRHKSLILIPEHRFKKRSPHERRRERAGSQMEKQSRLKSPRPQPWPCTGRTGTDSSENSVLEHVYRIIVELLNRTSIVVTRALMSSIPPGISRCARNNPPHTMHQGCFTQTLSILSTQSAKRLGRVQGKRARSKKRKLIARSVQRDSRPPSARVSPLDRNLSLHLAFLKRFGNYDRDERNAPVLRAVVRREETSERAIRHGRAVKGTKGGERFAGRTRFARFICRD